jgi:penicillin-binding protein 2
MRQNLFFILIIFVSITFVARLFYLQIYNSKPYSIYEDNAIGKVYTYPKRGYIYDRNNKLLVSNQPSYDIMITPGLVGHMDTTEFCELLKIDKNIFKKKN